MSDQMKKAVLIGIGALSLTKDAIERQAGVLAKRLALELIKRGDRERPHVQAIVEKELGKMLEKTGVVTDSDLERLESRVASIEDQLK